MAVDTMMPGGPDLGERSLSPEPQSPTTPGSPITPRVGHLSMDSLASIPLSETDLDYDHLSAEQVEQCLSTPRAHSSRHTRRPSSLEILGASWVPTRQSTLFDATQDFGPETPIPDPEEEDSESGRESAEIATAEAVSVRSNSTASSVRFTQTPSIRTESVNSSVRTPRRLSNASKEVEDEVDWQQLEKTEQQEKTDKELPEGVEDESTAFLLARLEQENAILNSDPKAAVHKNVGRIRRQSRPPSMAELRKLVTRNEGASYRYSFTPEMTLPEEPPAMTELEFWAALVQDYPSTAVRLPTLTTSKIRSGIPPPLRGIVWTSMSGARDKGLEESYERLIDEKSPYEGLINKDVGRSFPGVELFRDAGGEGQRMLGNVLKCFSLHDQDIGYCQGLGFLVGPLLMNVGEREAFCVLVRLMDHYSLRPSFLPSLSGLHMRIYQFSALLKQHLPELSEHFSQLGVEPAYLSQWFLSCFAVTCPLPMLFRIYDVIFAEGANETVMRVAMALMRRNEQKMRDSTEFEEVMQLLLGRAIWDSYGTNPDELVDDFTSLGSVITHARLAELEKEFDSQSSEAVGQSAGFLPDVQAAAGRFLGRLWAPSHASSKSTTTLSPPSAEKEGTRRGSFLRRSPSKQSISTLNDTNDSASSGSASFASTAPTEADADPTRDSTADNLSMRYKSESLRTVSVTGMASQTPSGISKEDRDMHTQIEDLLTALSELQREHAQLAAMLQKEREDRAEDHMAVRQLVTRLQPGEDDASSITKDVEDRRKTMPPPARDVAVKERPLSQPPPRHVQNDLTDLVDNVNKRLKSNARFSGNFETKAQLKSTLTRTREQLAKEEQHARDVAARLTEAEASITIFQADNEDLRSEVQELRTRVNEEYKERQKVEHTVRELQAQARSIGRRERLARTESMVEVPTLRLETSPESRQRKDSTSSAPAAGLRELRLQRRESSPSVQSLRIPRNQQRAQQEQQQQQQQQGGAAGSPPASATPQTPTSANGLTVASDAGFARRTTSLATQAVLATPEHEPAPEDTLLLELVNAKTAEAQARQEVDELRRSLAVQRRKQDEALRLAQAEADMFRLQAEHLRADVMKAADDAAAAANVDSARSEAGSSMPGTPGADEHHSPFGMESPVVQPEFIQPKIAQAGNGGTGGGWFWSRRTASTNTLPPVPPK